MNILEKIVLSKKASVAERQKLSPIPALVLSHYYSRPVISLSERLRTKKNSGIIAEFKRRSPSKGLINAQAEPGEVSQAYAKAGAAGLSVLTDMSFFGGTTDDLLKVRAANAIPILRKDFIIDAYQVHETKAMGADVMLLIAECLKKKEAKLLASLAKDIGLEVILEIHSEKQLEKYTPEIDIIGVNNRNLKTFEVNIEQSKRLFEHLPGEAVKISESGISSIEVINELQEVGYEGFLMGENFMKTARPGSACRSFIESIRCV